MTYREHSPVRFRDAKCWEWLELRSEGECWRLLACSPLLVDRKPPTRINVPKAQPSAAKSVAARTRSAVTASAVKRASTAVMACAVTAGGFAVAASAVNLG
jgi:hypothetical protein